MTADQPPVRGAQRARRDDEFGLLELQHLAARQARDVGPLRQGEGDDDRTYARGQHQDEQADPDQQRNRDHDVDEAHDDHVDAAAIETREATDQDADHHLRQRRREPDGERHARPEPDREPDVASERIGAEPVLQPRQLIGRKQIGLIPRLGGEHGGQDGKQREQDEQDDARQGGGVLPEPSPHIAPESERRPAGERLGPTVAIGREQRGVERRHELRMRGSTSP